MTLLKTMRR